MINAVFDTNICLQSFLSRNGPAFECVERVCGNDVRLFLTLEILDEFLNVITRPQILKKYPILTNTQTAKILRALVANAVFVPYVKSRFELSRDIDDEKFINLALDVEADFWVTRDRDLLDLRRDSEFISKFTTLKIVNPVEFLQVMRNT